MIIPIIYFSPAISGYSFFQFDIARKVKVFNFKPVKNGYYIKIPFFSFEKFLYVNK